MAWTSPTTRATGDLITAAIWNTDLVDNLSLAWHQVATGSGSGDTGITTTLTNIQTSASSSWDGSKLARIYLSWRMIGNFSGSSVTLRIYAYVDSTQIQEISEVTNVAAGDHYPGATAVIFTTPSSGSHTFSLKAQMGAGTASVYGPVNVLVDQQG